MRKRGTTDKSIQAAKLVKAKRLIVKGLSISEACERIGLPETVVRPVCTSEGWIAERGIARELIAEIDFPVEREIFSRRVYDLVSIGLERLYHQDDLCISKFAAALETLAKVGRTVLGMDASAGGAAQLTILARNAAVSVSPAA